MPLIVQCMQAYRIAQYELGPRKFWWWWCEGLKVHDALVVALWLALNILCIQQRSSLELPRLEGSSGPIILLLLEMGYASNCLIVALWLE